ncbi:cobalamin B12-binding domain-containing protein [Kutzneria albida]|uniref:B12-binding domain-containing protein n=1 Tax=Kutzneria albida DSM 43870 TaxID=1449976 RepID=W5W996_9PSEU|nr:cobalamin-dependent protein [Kutzneria albida]AHH97678.1 hypothetical protein KALB_4316 [Kutzneria albida DSM 43870]
MLALLAARSRLLAALRTADEHRALSEARRLIDGGMSLSALLLDVIAPVQDDIGKLWQEARLSIAEEHVATLISERVIALASIPADSTTASPSRGYVVVACVEGEFHTMPARILTEVLRVHGWHTTFLGASMPTDYLVTYVEQNRPSAVGLSCTLSSNLPRAHKAITACGELGMAVFVGGRGFGSQGQWARSLEVTTWAADALNALGVIDQIHADWSPSPSSARGADTEYASLRAMRSELFSTALSALDAYFPLTSDDDPRYDTAVDDLSHTLDFLAAAVYLDEPGLFTEFLAWTAEVRLSREISLRTIPHALGALEPALDNCPRTAAIVDEGQRLYAQLNH